MRHQEKAFDQALFAQAYTSFHSPAATPLVVAGPEYMAALLATFAEGHGPYNMSPTAIGLYLAHVDAAPAPVQLVGVQHWHDHG